jgi:hypothetical protein
MRTTLTLDLDVAAAVEQVRREEGIGLSEAVNRLIRRALAGPQPQRRYRHASADVGVRVDVTNIGEVLDLLDEH